jgi:hypothetical protein
VIQPSCESLILLSLLNSYSLVTRTEEQLEDEATGAGETDVSATTGRNPRR